MLPGFAFAGSYTRNQYSSSITVAGPGTPPSTFTITPTNQLNGTATLNVPFVNLANFERIAAANTTAESSSRELDAVRLSVEGQVVQDYYQLVADTALVATSNRALEYSERTSTSRR